ncbi:hypothetical protein FBU30_001888 [Linnemannia zychae]|nr:hypothetical protein FBU30_001888 [Linnemannia zychae]
MDPKPTTTPTPKPKPPPTVKPPVTPTTATPSKKPTATTAPRDSTTDSSSSTAATISPTSAPDASSSGGGLPVGAIAGIAAAGALILLFIVSIFVCKKRRARRYAARPSGYDPSRDPINPNDVLSSENKYDQRTPTLAHSNAVTGALNGNRMGENSRDNESGFISYPLALRGASDDKAQEYASYQDPRTQQTQRALEQEYNTYEDHIQSHYEQESPEMRPASLRPGPGPGPVSPTKGPVQNNNRTQHSPAPISTSYPSMDLPRNSPGPISPTQKGSSQVSPRSRHPLASPTGSRGQDTVIVNDMGNEFVIQTSSNNSRHDSFDQDGSVVQSELSYRRGVTPRKSQESNLGGGAAPPVSVFNGQYPASGSPSPMALGPQRNHAGHPGPNPGSSSNSAFSSPRQGPTGYSTSPPIRPSHYSPQHQYQPPPPQQPYQQYSQDHMNGYGSPPMRPQQRPPGSGGYSSPTSPVGPGAMRSPPIGPQPRGGYSPRMGPSYPQQQQQQQQYPQQYQPQSNYPPQQQTPNFRPRNNNNNNNYYY